MEYGQHKDISSLTIFAGDRDFFDAIQYVQQELNKPVKIIAFKDNISHRLTKEIKTQIVLIDNYWPTICEIPYDKPPSNEILKLEAQMKSQEDEGNNKSLKPLMSESTVDRMIA